VTAQCLRLLHGCCNEALLGPPAEGAPFTSALYIPYMRLLLSGVGGTLRW
jgi:hypothetical protein